MELDDPISIAASNCVPGAQDEVLRLYFHVPLTVRTSLRLMGQGKEQVLGPSADTSAQEGDFQELVQAAVENANLHTTSTQVRA